VDLVPNDRATMDQSPFAGFYTIQDLSQVLEDDFLDAAAMVGVVVAAAAVLLLFNKSESCKLKSSTSLPYPTWPIVSNWVKRHMS
jgi:hypothetical protein